MSCRTLFAAVDTAYASSSLSGNDVQRPIHNRMLVLLTGGDTETWLNEKSAADDRLDLAEAIKGGF